MSPLRAPRRCSAPNCRALITGRPSYCPEHLRDTRPNSNARGYGYQWVKLRSAFLRANPWYLDCAKQGIQTRATTPDHVVPRSQGGSDEWSNLEPVCTRCHSKRTTTYDGGFGHKRKDKP